MNVEATAHTQILLFLQIAIFQPPLGPRVIHTGLEKIYPGKRPELFLYTGSGSLNRESWTLVAKAWSRKGRHCNYEWSVMFPRPHILLIP